MRTKLFKKLLSLGKSQLTSTGLIDRSRLTLIKKILLLSTLFLSTLLLGLTAPRNPSSATPRKRTSQLTNSFQDVTKSSGIQWTKQKGDDAFSVAWVDFNSDGLADLWISGHGYGFGKNKKVPTLYLNQGGAKFKNIISQIWPTNVGADSHGSSWADFDNDGDPDLLVSVGANLGTRSGGNLFFVNRGGKLQPRANRLTYPLGRGRSSVWFDQNNDGLLDILLLTGKRPDGEAPIALFQQIKPGFKDVSTNVGLEAHEPSHSAQLADLTGDGNLDLILQGTYTFPQKVYDISPGSLKDLTNKFPQISDPPTDQSDEFQDTQAPRDVAIADFNGDLHSDMFLVRSLVSANESSIYKASSHAAAALLLLTKPGEVGVSFKANSNVHFDFFKNRALQPSEIFIGASGFHPAQAAFSVSPSDPRVQGIKAHTPGSDAGLYIGYDPASQTWKALLSNPKKQNTRLIFETTRPFSNLTRIGFGPPKIAQNALRPILLVYDPTKGRYTDQTFKFGLGSPLLAQSVVAGDFDNDMDVDLYVSCGYTNFDVPNILYRNQGDDTFIKVPLAGGAAGRVVGPHSLTYGMGQRLAVADYDNDGFLDIFAGDTVFESTAKTYLGAPPQLFHNLGNRGHWIEIDLQGIKSNRDAIGARVLVTAGGVTQIREQGGGTHHFGQNQRRIHFGLANNTKVDSLVIHWPSGMIQKLNNVPADQVLHVIENSTTE